MIVPVFAKVFKAYRLVDILHGENNMKKININYGSINFAPFSAFAGEWVKGYERGELNED